MRDSYEKFISEELKKNGLLPEKMEFSILKFFWQSTGFLNAKNSIPKFLRSNLILSKFSENEIRILIKYLHQRKFLEGEVIFQETDPGIGFYFVFDGKIDLYAQRGNEDQKIAVLERGDSFGEFAILQQNPARMATAVTRESCTLLGLLKPDLDDLLEDYPTVGAKLVQSLSEILATRMLSMAQEIRYLKYKLSEHEIAE